MTFISPKGETRPNPLQSALTGIRVIDFSQIAAGPLCTMLLADMGADVIKVEAPSGDIGRSLGPPFIDGESPIFLGLNRNKRGVSLDLKTDRGRRLAHKLIATADVVVESFRPGVADRLGIGYNELQEIFPDLIYCSISAYGQTGAWSAKPGVDGVLQAVTGLMSITGAEGDAPVKVQAPIVDMATGLQAAIAILAAIVQKKTSGTPVEQLDVNLFASSVLLQQVPLTTFLNTGELPARCGSGAPYATPNEAYATSDGHILIAAYQPSRWQNFCTVIGIPTLASDPRFSDLPARMHNRTALTECLEEVLRTKTTAQWCRELEAADIICAPVNDYSSLMTLIENGALQLLTRTAWLDGRTLVSPGFTIGGPAMSCSKPAPTLGQHNEEFFADTATLQIEGKPHF